MVLKRYTAIATCVIAASLAAGCGRSNSTNKHNATTSGNGATTAAVAPSGNAGTAETASAAIAGPIDPCKLLTKADAQKVLGEPVTDGRVNHDVGFAPGTKCSYFSTPTADDPGGSWGASVEVFDQATFDKQGSYFKSPSQAYHRGYKGATSVSTNEVKDVSGVGDGAYWNGHTLIVLDKGVEVDIVVNANFHIPPGPGEKVDAEEDAAEMHATTNLAKTVVLPHLEKM